MIYILYGEDTKKSRGKLKSLLSSLFLKKPKASFFKVDTDNFNEVRLEEFIFSQGLFEQKYIIQMDGLLEDKNIASFLMSKLGELQKSENIFILWEIKINSIVLKKLEKYTAKLQEFPLKKNNKERLFATEKGTFCLGDFNIFDLAVCLGKRNKKDLWVLYQKTRLRNIPVEKVSGILFGQLRTMFQTLRSRTAEQAGLKSFVFNKTKGYLKNYSEKELKKMSADLVYLYHNARRSGLELDLALEKFILGL